MPPLRCTARAVGKLGSSLAMPSLHADHSAPPRPLPRPHQALQHCVDGRSLAGTSLGALAWPADGPANLLSATLRAFAAVSDNDCEGAGALLDHCGPCLLQQVRGGGWRLAAESRPAPAGASAGAAGGSSEGNVPALPAAPCSDLATLLRLLQVAFVPPKGPFFAPLREGVQSVLLGVPHAEATDTLRHALLTAVPVSPFGSRRGGWASRACPLDMLALTAGCAVLTASGLAVGPAWAGCSAWLPHPPRPPCIPRQAFERLGLSPRLVLRTCSDALLSADAAHHVLPLITRVRRRRRRARRCRAHSRVPAEPRALLSGRPRNTIGARLPGPRQAAGEAPLSRWPHPDFLAYLRLLDAAGRHAIGDALSADTVLQRAVQVGAGP